MVDSENRLGVRIRERGVCRGHKVCLDFRTPYSMTMTRVLKFLILKFWYDHTWSQFAVYTPRKKMACCPYNKAMCSRTLFIIQS